MRFFCGLMLALAVSVACGDIGGQQSGSQVDPVAQVFQEQGVIGTLVVASADGEVLHVHNAKRAETRFSPASTFKIPNTLIALDTAVVTSKDATFKWDGSDKGLPAWNKDQTLESAFKVSCVWCYQEIAGSVGSERYSTALAGIDYGNQKMGDHVDQFWLNDDLQISAHEQIAFLRKLMDYSLPYRREHVDIVKDIMLAEQTADYSIYAKTGWTGAKLGVGWYVGYVEKGDKVWLFAMNMRMDRAEQAALRKELTTRSLRALGIL